MWKKGNNDGLWKLNYNECEISLTKQHDTIKAGQREREGEWESGLVSHQALPCLVLPLKWTRLVRPKTKAELQSSLFNLYLSLSLSLARPVCILRLCKDEQAENKNQDPPI